LINSKLGQKNNWLAANANSS